MKTYHKSDLDIYMENDWIYKMLVEAKGEDNNRYDEWLYQIEAKRMIYADVYGDILVPSGQKKRVIDIGGGILL